MRKGNAQRVAFIILFINVLIVGSDLCRASTPSFELTLRDAEKQSLQASNQLKSALSTQAAASEQADAGYANLWPRLSLEGTYRYVTTVPTVQLPIPGIPPLQFGANSNYSIGPTLSYQFWDTGSTRSAYHSLVKLAEARKEDQRNAELQLLMSVRMAYVRVQLALEQMRLVSDSLNLARAQNRDIEVNFRAGASSKLDWVNSQREVLSYQLQFKRESG